MLRLLWQWLVGVSVVLTLMVNGVAVYAWFEDGLRAIGDVRLHWPFFLMVSSLPSGVVVVAGWQWWHSKPRTAKARLRATVPALSHVRQVIATFLLDDPDVLVYRHQSEGARAVAIELADKLWSEFGIRLPSMDDPRYFHYYLACLIPIARRGDLQAARDLDGG